jgi:PAS domain S-box-containing protein
MKTNHLSPTALRIGEIVVTAALYYATARLGFLIILPAEQASALWPASGLALAAALIFGSHTCLGVFIGCFLAQLSAPSGSNAPLVAVVIAAGATLQTGLISTLFRRFFPDLSPNTIRRVLVAIPVTALGTLVTPILATVGVSFLSPAHLPAEKLLFFVTMWIGEMTGTLAFAPALVVLGRQYLRSQKVAEPYLWPLTSIILTLTLFTSMAFYNGAHNNLHQSIRSDINEMVQTLQTSMDRQTVEAVTILRAFFASSQDVNRDEFRIFTAQFLSNYYTISSVAWAPRIARSERQALEASVRREGFSNFAISQTEGDEKSTVEPERSEYLPTLYVEPFVSNRSWMGYDNASSPERMAAIVEARDSGHSAVTKPIKLEWDSQAATGVLFVMPIYRNGALISTVEERRAAFQGVVIGTVHVSNLLEQALQSVNRHDIELYLYDIGDPSQPEFLAFYPSLSGSQSQPADADDLTKIEAGTFQSAQLKIADRAWLVVARPGPAYPTSSASTLAWISLLVGCLVAAAFLSYLNARTQAETRLAHSEAEFRALAEDALIGILRIKTPGQILYANEALARILGLQSPKDFLRIDIHSFFVDPAQLDRLIRLFMTSTEVRNFEVNIVTAQGEERIGLISASTLKGVITATFVDITERIRANAEIRRLSRVVDQMADTVVITDANGSIEYVNPAFEQLSGYSQEEALGKTPRILKSGLHPAEFYQHVWEVILRGEVFQGEFINRSKTGELYYESKTITPIRNAEGKITQFVATGQNTTERKRAARLQETVYRIAEAAQNVESLHDLYPQIHQRISDVMDARNFYIALYDELTGLMQFVYWVDEKDPWDSTPFSPGNGLTAHVLRSGKSLLCDTSMKQELLSKRPYQRLGSPCLIWLGVPLITGGKTIGVMAVQHYTDPHAYTEHEQHILEFVSSQVATAIDRQMAREALVESQANLEAAQSIAHIGSWDLNFAKQRGEWSKEMFALFRYEPVQEGVPPLYDEFFELIHPEDRELLRNIQQQAMVTGIPTTTEYRSNPALGEIRYFKAAFQASTDGQGNRNGLIGTVQDITEIKLATDQLRESERQMKQAQRIAHVGSWNMDLHNRKLSWSDEHYWIFGQSPASFTPTEEEFLKAIHPEDLEVTRQAFKNSIQNHRPYDIVHRIIRKDGAVRYIHARGQTYYSADGTPERAFGTVQDITEQRQMELNVRERVKELTCLFAVSRVLEGNFTTAEVCQKISKLLIPAMQFPQLAAAVMELDGERYATENYQDGLAHCLSAAIVVNGELRGQLQVFYTQEEAFILPEEQQLLNNVTHMFGLWLERQESNTALQASEEQFRQLAENIQEVFWIFDIAGEKTIYISPAYEMVWGRSCQSLYDNPWEFYESILPEDQPRMKAMKEKEARGERAEAEYRVLRPDGTIRWLWDRSFPIYDSNGNLVRTGGVATDLTEVKTAQIQLEELNAELEMHVEERTADLKKSEAMYRALFENSNDAIFLMTPDGRELPPNQRALDMIGYTLEEFMNLARTRKNPVTVMEQRDDAELRLSALLRGEIVPLYERIIVSKYGKRIYTEINLSVVRDADGKATYVQSVVRDISERKKAEAALRESRDALSAANAALEKASRLKDEFLASMSHELRTPLTGILGLSEALQMQTYGDLNEKQLKSLRNIENSGRHLLDLINDILDLSKIEAGKLDIQFDTCSVADACQASLQLVKGMAHQKKQNIAFTMTPESITIRADLRRLKQMLVNLLSNAIKFTPEAGGVGLEVVGDAEKQVVFFTVWDKGIGIRVEDMDRLFKPFVQLDSKLARQYSGTGLGLSLVQRMVELHGGSVSVESTFGEGSRFTIVLPWNTALSAPAPEPFESDTGLLAGSVLNGSLLIEDNALDAEQAVRYLEAIGVHSIVHPVMDGALEKAASLHPSVILLDLYLTDGFGLDLLAQIKSDPRTANIPVIITSVEERRTEAQKMGAAGYLVKPYQLDDLRNELSKAAAVARLTKPVMVIGSSTAPLVMIVDDNEIILDTLANYLGSKGYRTALARSGFELLERVTEIQPNLILMDIQMPGMDGMEAARRLRAHPDPTIGTIPVIAVTALVMTGDREKCLQAGMNDYISKPFNLKQLSITINKWLEIKGAA